MVKRTVETYECDVCGQEGERYTIGFPEGVLALDRCSKHDQVITRLRDEKGTWSTPAAATRSVFRVSTPEEIARQKRARHDGVEKSDGVGVVPT